MYLDPREEEQTICTAVAPEDVLTVRRYRDTCQPYGPARGRPASAQISARMAANLQVSTPRLAKVHDRDQSQVTRRLSASRTSCSNADAPRGDRPRATTHNAVAEELPSDEDQLAVSRVRAGRSRSIAATPARSSTTVTYATVARSHNASSTGPRRPPVAFMPPAHGRSRATPWPLPTWGPSRARDRHERHATEDRARVREVVECSDWA